MSAYYNECDPLKAEIIREAIKAGAIAAGDVDARSITEVRATDLVGYTQCHFFAGGGFWSLALRQAGWPDDRPVWTGSCPCPSFSAAGKGQGFSDPRHLWPHWARLIRQCHPPTIFGEQVSAAIGHGWLDLVQTDLEAQEYAFGKAVFGACSVGAPHIRQRLYFVAEFLRESGQRRARGVLATEAERSGERFADGNMPLRPEHGGEVDFVAQSQRAAERRRGLHGPREGGEALGAGTSTEFIRRSIAFNLVDAESGRLGMCGSAPGNGGHTAQPSEPCGLSVADGGDAGPERKQRSGEQRQQPQDGGAGSLAESLYAERWPVDVDGSDGRDGKDAGRQEAHGEFGTCGKVCGPGPLTGFWRDADWIGCRDGKFRPVKSGTFPLATGYFGRVGLLRLAGDAICVPAAQAFIEAYLKIKSVEK